MFPAKVYPDCPAPGRKQLQESNSQAAMQELGKIKIQKLMPGRERVFFFFFLSLLKQKVTGVFIY